MEDCAESLRDGCGDEDGHEQERGLAEHREDPKVEEGDGEFYGARDEEVDDPCSEAILRVHQYQFRFSSPG